MMVLDAATTSLSTHSMVMKILKADNDSSNPHSQSHPLSQGPHGQHYHLPSSSSGNTTATSSSSEACMNIVHNLMCHRKSGESEEFSKFAIESLIKKLKDRREELDSLILAVTSNGATQTGCVTIQRTLDSRMQIAGRKCFPHLIYARLWRWADAHKTELHHLPFCRYGFNKKLDWVCVNPYHYERIASSALDISSLALSPPVERRKSAKKEDEVFGSSKQRRHSSDLQQLAASNPAEASLLRLSVQSLLDENPLCAGLKSDQPRSNTITYEPSNALALPPAPAAQQPPTSSANSSLSLENVDAATANLLNFMQWVSSANATLAAAATGVLPPPPEPLSSEPPTNTSAATAINEDASAVAMDAAETAALLDPVAASGGAPVPVLYPTNGAGGSSNNGQASASYSAGSSGGGGYSGRASQQQHQLSTLSSSSSTSMGGGAGGWGVGGAGGGQPPPNAPPGGSMQPSQLTNQRPPEYWCNIAYFELDQQVGEHFKVPSHYTRVIVDGYTDPSSRNRFCLGQLSNVHSLSICLSESSCKLIKLYRFTPASPHLLAFRIPWSEQSEKSRLYIGKGVELDIVGEGDVWIRCLSEFSIFVQSYYLDREAGRAPGDAVHKIYPGAYIKVFDIRQCHEQMRHLAQMAQAAVMRQAAAVAGSLPAAAVGAASEHAAGSSDASAAAGVGVDDFRRLCNLRLSFVKGWGPDYPRHDIKETPCWIEIQLHRPLQLLDEVLQAMPLNDLKPTRHFFYYQNQMQPPPPPPTAPLVPPGPSQTASSSQSHPLAHLHPHQPSPSSSQSQQQQQQQQQQQPHMTKR